MIDLENFAQVFAETLSEADQEAFKKLLGKRPDAKAIWDMVLHSHVACLKPVMFIRTGDKELISREAFETQFNRIVNLLPRKSGEKDYRDKAALCAKANVRLASAAVYEPGQGEWVGTKFNMYKPSACTPLAEPPRQIADHIRYLIPDARERRLFVDYLAWMVQHPDRKLQFALLLVGRGGTGKSWLSGLIEVLFGRHNVTVLPKGQSIADRFDASAENKQAIFIDELVPNGKDDLAQAVAPLITQPNVWIERKGIQKFEVPNRVNLIAVSNHPNAIKITADNRRWLVVRTTDDVRFTDDDGQPTPETQSYYDRLYKLTPEDRTPTDEARRLLHFLQHRDLSGFNGQSLAPMTEAKREVAEFSETAIQSQVRAALEAKRGAFAHVTFTPDDVYNENFAQYAEQVGKSPKIILAEITRALEDCGCRRVSNKQSWVNGKGVRIWTVHKRHLAALQKLTPPQLAAEYKREREGASANDNVADSEADAADFA
jgi:hypothetical protein